MMKIISYNLESAVSRYSYEPLPVISFAIMDGSVYGSGIRYNGMSSSHYSQYISLKGYASFTFFLYVGNGAIDANCVKYGKKITLVRTSVGSYNDTI